MSRIVKAAGVALGTGAVMIGGAGLAMADAGADAAAVHSPGFLSGNVIQVPIHIPVNVCGNTVNVVGLLNPAFGNHCENNSGDHKDKKADDSKNGGHKEHRAGGNKKDHGQGYGG
ncbi:chaplin [Streptomyces sp. NPDC005402]|uniref:chaplin n=1 Tax=Streptomyces sp. NPDC005402 TaxID=3155338 RepID=UPI0033B9783F